MFLQTDVVVRLQCVFQKEYDWSPFKQKNFNEKFRPNQDARATVICPKTLMPKCFRKVPVIRKLTPRYEARRISINVIPFDLKLHSKVMKHSWVPFKKSNNGKLSLHQNWNDILKFFTLMNPLNTPIQNETTRSHCKLRRRRVLLVTTLTHPACI